MVTQTSIVAKLRESKARGTAFLLEHQRADGALGEPERAGLSPYYKALWAFAAAGEAEAGNRLASWIRAQVQTDEGDFAGPMRGALQDNNYAYPAGWMVAGAFKMGRFDVATPGLRFLKTLQHPETGGFRMQRDKMDAIQDLLNAGQCGNALLFGGDIAGAQRVAGFLRMMYEAQPRPSEELFLVYKPGTGLRTEFAPERQRLHSIRIDTPRQPYFNPGMVAAFLCRLAQADGDTAHVELAKQYMEISFHCLDEMYETAQAGKVGWGSALIYGVSGDDRFRALAERTGEALMAQQTESGGWDNTGGYVNDAIRIEVTGEFVVILDEMIAGLSMR